MTRAALDELLRAVDLKGRTGDGAVRHEVGCERGDVVRADDAPDRHGAAQLLTALLEVVTEQVAESGVSTNLRF